MAHASTTSAAVFIPLSICQTGTRLLNSFLVIDALSAQHRALITAILGVICAVVCACVSVARTQVGLVCWSILYGVSTGLYLSMVEILPASLFGTVALGRLLGVVRSACIIATGIAPVVFSASFEHTGAYQLAVVFASGTYFVSSAVMLALVRRAYDELSDIA